MYTLPELLRRRCAPMKKSEALPENEILLQLSILPGWELQDGALYRRYDFGNFYETLAFVNALGYIAHQEDHHPELRLSYGYCEVRWNTHSAGGITLNDFICAAKSEALLERA